MADIIDPSTVKSIRRGRTPKYPWAEWSDGQWREAVRGEDYTTTDKGFKSTLYGHAVRTGLRTEMFQTERGVAFRFVR